VHRRRDQPLLRAVVQVALDAPPLGVGGRHDTRLGSAQVGEPTPTDYVQPRVVQREP
jgi:hypothetical protein